MFDTAQHEPLVFDLDSDEVGFAYFAVHELLVLLLVLPHFLQSQGGHSQKFLGYVVEDSQRHGSTVVVDFDAGVVAETHHTALAFVAFLRVYVDLLFAEVAHFEDEFVFLYFGEVGAEYIGEY